MYDDAMKLLKSDEGRALCDTSLTLEDLRHGIAILKGEVDEELKEAKRRLVDNRYEWVVLLVCLADCFFV
jgi:N-terminal acetyltransferase B complex non-catalytic subunit